MSSKRVPGSMLVLPSPRLTFAALLATGLALVLLFSLRGATPAAAETEACPNAEFRTGPSAKLPDCRAYEQVSPVNKYGQAMWKRPPVAGSSTWAAASFAWFAPGSDRVLLSFDYGDPPRGSSFPGVATRGESGWASTTLFDGIPATTQLEGPTVSGPQFLFASADRSSLLFSIGMPISPGQPESSFWNGNGGVHTKALGGPFKWMSEPTSPNADLPPGSDGVGLRSFMPVGGSEDLSTVYFIARQTLTPEDVASGRTWDQSWALYKVKDGVLSNAGTLPDGTVDPAGSMSAGAELGDSSLTSSPNPVATLGAVHVVSRDGDRALFVDLGARSVPGRVPQLYMHRDGQPSLLLSKPQDDTAPLVDSTGVVPIWATDTNDGGAGYSFGITTGSPVVGIGDEDLDTVFFSTRDALTDDAVADGTEVNTYRYEVATGELELLPELQRPGGPDSHDRLGNVYAMSDDGSRILFRTPAGELKLWRDGGSTLTLATGVGLVNAKNDGISEARFSDDGKTVIFTSREPINGEPNHPAGNTSTQSQVYRFSEDDDASPTCISCPPLDATVRGPATFDLLTPLNQGFGGSKGVGDRITASRALSADGKRVFFTTSSTLDPRDRNTVADVYEWSSEHEAPVLISSGDPRSRGEGLVDSDASGDNVLFASEMKLTDSDLDQIYDFYVARVGGGLEVPPPFDPEESCKTGTCQGDASPTPESTDPGSAGFSGGGNVASVTVKRLAHKAGARAKVVVRVSGPGKVRVKGQRIRGASKRTSEAGTYRLRVKLNRKAKRALRRNGKVRANARVTYRSRSGERASKKLSVKFTKPNSKRGNRKGSR